MRVFYICVCMCMYSSFVTIFQIADIQRLQQQRHQNRDHTYIKFYICIFVFAVCTSGRHNMTTITRHYNSRLLVM